MSAHLKSRGMTDLETLQDLLNRAGWHLAEPFKWRHWRFDPLGYGLTRKTPDDESDERCADCVTQLMMDGEWTGEFEAHFSANGTIQHIDISGD